MASIQFSQGFTMPVEELKLNLDKLADSLADRLQLVSHWQSERCLIFKGSGASGEIKIEQEIIHLSVTLGMMMGMFKASIEEEIREKINTYVY